MFPPVNFPSVEWMVREIYSFLASSVLEACSDVASETSQQAPFSHALWSDTKLWISTLPWYIRPLEKQVFYHLVLQQYCQSLKAEFCRKVKRGGDTVVLGERGIQPLLGATVPHSLLIMEQGRLEIDAVCIAG